MISQAVFTINLNNLNNILFKPSYVGQKDDLRMLQAAVEPGIISIGASFPTYSLKKVRYLEIYGSSMAFLIHQYDYILLYVLLHNGRSHIHLVN